MKKITSYRLFALMLCCRVFSMMIRFPFENYALYMLAGAFSTAIQAVMVIPVLKLHNRLQCKSRAAVLFRAAIYAAFFLAASFVTIGDFAYYLDSYFSNYIPRIMSVICITFAAVYLGKMNIGVIGKTAVVGAAAFLAVTVMIVIGSYNVFEPSNFYLAQENIQKTFWKYTLTELSRGDSLVLFVFLLPKTEGKPQKAVWNYLWVKLAVMEIILAFITIILGDFAKKAALPFFSLAAYSHTHIIERFDAVFMSIWVVITVIKLGAYLHCAGDCIRDFIPKLDKSYCTALAGIISASAALLFLLPHNWKNISQYDGGWVIIVILVTIIPIILYGGRKGEQAVKEYPET